MRDSEFPPSENAISSAEFLRQSPVAERASRLNSQTRVLSTYGQHRQKTMSLLSSAAAERGNGDRVAVTVLGAGNCMDLDLRQLTQLFMNVSLVDLDPEALECGLRTVNETQRSSIQTIAPFDLATPLAAIRKEQLTDPQFVEVLCRQLSAPFAEIPVVPADVVVSACVLSQLLSAVTHLAAEPHPGFLPLIQSVRRGHLIRMLQLLKTGGRGILITDLVSSESLPTLTSIADSELPKLLAHALATGNFFSGLHPGVLLQDLATVPEIAPQIESPAMTDPWRWQMGQRTYAVYAIGFRKH